jgi:predicted AlkP superfamily pyrophosphatase or phosphodiesterase
MKKRKLVVLSADAMIPEDVEYLSNKPFVQKILREGVWINSLRTVYPANTYPCHASMITGCYPDKTGVDTNFYQGTSTWRAERDNIKVKTLIDYAKENGYTTANVFWPVLGGDKNIDYNIPEYFRGADCFKEVLQKYGMTEQVYQDIVVPNLDLTKGYGTAGGLYTDDFIFACARDMILKYQPDILLIHPCPLDTQRHKDGVFSDNVTKRLEESYEYVVQLYDAVKQIGEEDNTDFVWMSDHGQMTIESWYRFLVNFKNEGLIETDKDGNMIGGPVQATPFNNSVKIKVLDNSVYDKVKKMLDDDIANKKGIVYYSNEYAEKELHTPGDFDFLVDSDGNYGVGREAYPDQLGNIYSTYAPGVAKKIGEHGHTPDMGYQPTLIAIGPDFKQGVTLDRVETVNIPVTLAKCLGITMEDRDGVVVEEILK